MIACALTPDCLETALDIVEIVQDAAETGTELVSNGAECLLLLDIQACLELCQKTLGQVGRCSEELIRECVNSYITMGECVIVFLHAETADAVTRLTFLGQELGEGRIDDDGTISEWAKGDFFQHCFWSGLVTVDLGSSKAEKYLTAYEGTAIPADVDERHWRNFDLNSNARGRSYGSPFFPGLSPGIPHGPGDSIAYETVKTACLAESLTGG